MLEKLIAFTYNIQLLLLSINNLGFWTGLGYWRLNNRIIKNPQIIPAIIENLEREIKNHLLRGQNETAGMVEVWVMTLRNYYEAVTDLEKS